MPVVTVPCTLINLSDPTSARAAARSAFTPGSGPGGGSSPPSMIVYAVGDFKPGTEKYASSDPVIVI